MNPKELTPVRFFIQSILKYKLWLFLNFLFILFEIGVEKLIPYYFSQIINTISAKGEINTTLSQITTPLTLFVSFSVLGVIIFGINYIIRNFIGARLPVHIIQWTTGYVMRHSPKFFMDNQSGKLTNKINQLSRTVFSLHNASGNFFAFLVGTIITLGCLFFLSFYLGCLRVYFVLLLSFRIWRSGKKMHAFSAEHSERQSETNGILVDIINNSLLVKSFGNFSQETNSLKKMLRKQQQAKMLFYGYTQKVQTIQLLIIESFKFIMVILSLWLWKNNVLNVGEIVLALMWTGSLTQMYRWCVWEMLNVHDQFGTLKSALTVLNTPHQLKDIPKAKRMTVKKGKIQFKEVCFGYEGKKPLFKKLNLTIAPKEKVGIIGVSGSGKSTIVNLLQRFFDIQSGEILIDGQNIKEVTQKSLHKNICVIPQDTVLFHRSLMENIAYGFPNAGIDQVKRAAKKAYAHDFIQVLPDKYNSLVGERGVKLSGGQRQRIAIARAFLKNAPICILDEATSALDTESEQYIQKSVKELFKNKTVIAIAHRLSTLNAMDRIIVVKNGKIIEQGPPKELLKKGGKYAQLWKLQNKVTKQED